MQQSMFALSGSINFPPLHPYVQPNALHPTHATLANFTSKQGVTIDIGQISREFSYDDLVAATGGFSKDQILGHGSFGAVYSGRLLGGTEVAVKSVADPVASGFENEVRMLSKYRHPNLLMLMGFAKNGPNRLLVYERMHNGDCDKRLKTPSLNAAFTWNQRLSVLLDCAKGLAYLANSVPKAFHRDIKPSNMLLDQNMVAKMADFGLACEMSSSHPQSIRLPESAGTVGYACPRYISSGIVSESSEVFSFGVCILEFLTNQPPAVSSPYCPNQVVYLAETVHGRLDQLMSMLDPRAGWPDNVARHLGSLASMCTSPDQDARPSFVEIVKKLSGKSSNPRSIEASRPETTSAVTRSPLRAIDQTSPYDLRSQAPAITGFGNSSIGRILQTTRIPLKPEEPSVRLRITAIANPVVSELVTADWLNDEFVVGRNRQSTLFTSLLPQENLRLCVSREHFKVVRVNVQNGNARFGLINLSGNGTLLNGKGFLERIGDRCELVSGDVIRLVQTTAGGVHNPFIDITFEAG